MNANAQCRVRVESETTDDINEANFDIIFQRLTGRAPFPWQHELFSRLLEGNVPSRCEIPTGLGKTSVVAVWLIALAYKPEKLPRRLVYVVNRRTVVDQTTNEVERLRDRLDQAGLSDRLRNLCSLDPVANEPVLAVSTLRGQFADNRQWSVDPARPAIIVGTVDMIGSRLLFGGYGVGFRSKPLHAGLLGQDVLVVHDEAHLEPAFQGLIDKIRGEQESCKELRVFRVMQLTATTRAQQCDARADVLTLTAEEMLAPKELPDPPQEPIHHLWRRVHACKTLHLLGIEDEKKQLAGELVRAALRFNNSARPVLLFAQSVEVVEKIVEQLRKKGKAVQQLTGTLRGLERDRLPGDPVFARFLPPSDRPKEASIKEGTVYLVCTSAGEVGINISADHLVCDLTTFESMAQRFGRVNRFGDSADTEIHVIHPQKFEVNDPYQQSRQRTLELLRRLQGDASPAALGGLDPIDRDAAFSAEPTILPATDILFDCWALTTIRDRLPGRPSLESYLHGVRPGEPPETHVAWREEVEILENLRDIYPPEDILEDYPLKPHELLRDRADRVFKHLAAIAARHPQKPVWLVDDRGSVEILTLGELADRDNRDRINYRTVLLPPSVGGLTDGLLDGNSNTAGDVADEWYADKQNTIRHRVRLWDDQPAPPGMRLIRSIDTRPDAEASDRESDTSQRRYWNWYELPATGETDGSLAAPQAVTLDDHTNQVEAIARSLVEKLGLARPVKQAVVLAAKYHDLGKKRPIWQRAIGNTDGTRPLAKSGNRLPPVELTSYRHEFGSLLDVQMQSEFPHLSDDVKDLVLHLIAAHHGRARPHFPRDEAFDPNRPQIEADAVAAEVPRRFARLQRRYGRWGLAYLESLVRAADWAASAAPIGSPSSGEGRPSSDHGETRS